MFLALASYYNHDISSEEGPLYPIAIKSVAEINPTTQTYCMYAEWLMSEGRYSEACEIFRKASEMVPLKLSSRYGILKCQISQSENEKALETAEQIMMLPVKIHSLRSIEIMANTRHLADSLCCQTE